jgi:hypothetical protein
VSPNIWPDFSSTYPPGYSPNESPRIETCGSCFVGILYDGSFGRGAKELREEEEILVQGGQPGPKMWRISNGENQLCMLGSLSPLPNKIEWDA